VGVVRVRASPFLVGPATNWLCDFIVCGVTPVCVRVYVCVSCRYDNFGDDFDEAAAAEDDARNKGMSGEGGDFSDDDGADEDEKIFRDAMRDVRLRITHDDFDGDGVADEDQETKERRTEAARLEKLAELDRKLAAAGKQAHRIVDAFRENCLRTNVPVERVSPRFCTLKVTPFALFVAHAGMDRLELKNGFAMTDQESWQASQLRELPVEYWFKDKLPWWMDEDETLGDGDDGDGGDKKSARDKSLQLRADLDERTRLRKVPEEATEWEILEIVRQAVLEYGTRLEARRSSAAPPEEVNKHQEWDDGASRRAKWRKENRLLCDVYQVRRYGGARQLSPTPACRGADERRLFLLRGTRATGDEPPEE